MNKERLIHIGIEIALCIGILIYIRRTKNKEAEELKAKCKELESEIKQLKVFVISLAKKMSTSERKKVEREEIIEEPKEDSNDKLKEDIKKLRDMETTEQEELPPPDFD